MELFDYLAQTVYLSDLYVLQLNGLTIFVII
jgi:hypothetical protein